MLKVFNNQSAEIKPRYFKDCLISFSGFHLMISFLHLFLTVIYLYFVAKSGNKSQNTHQNITKTLKLYY